MQGITKLGKAQLQAGVLWHGLVLVSIIALALMGQVVPEQAGWVLGGVGTQVEGRRMGWARGGRVRASSGHAALWRQRVRSGQIALLRSLLLWGLWNWSGQVGPAWLRLWPWVLGLWRGVGVYWPGLRRPRGWGQVEQWLARGQQGLILAYVGLGVVAGLRWWWGGWDAAGGPVNADGAGTALLLGAGCLDWQCQSCGGEEARVTVARQADGSYEATLCGHFTLQVAGDSVFRRRLLLLFLGLLAVPGPQRGGRRTRDGRTPFVTEMQLAAWFGMPQPVVSRLYQYWLHADWANLLSLHSAEVLTGELVQRIVEVCATFPWWEPEQVRQHLCAQSVRVSLAQVEQAFAQSGWSRLRQTLFERYDLSGTAVQLREGWLVGQLLAQVQGLLERLEGGLGLTPEPHMAGADLQQLAAAAQVLAAPPLPAEPWLRRVAQVLLGPWAVVGDPLEASDGGQVHCPACGSSAVKRKGHKPRLKQYYDAAHQVQQVAVYRYFCGNPQCQTQTFTDMPAGLLPYSPYRTEPTCWPYRCTPGAIAPIGVRVRPWAWPA